MIWTGTKRDQTTRVLDHYVLRVKQLKKGLWWWMLTGEQVTHAKGKTRRDQKKITEGAGHCRKVALNEVVALVCSIDARVKAEMLNGRQRMWVGRWIFEADNDMEQLRA